MSSGSSSKSSAMRTRPRHAPRRSAIGAVAATATSRATGLPFLGDDDVLSGFRAFDELGQLRFCLVHTDLSHAGQRSKD